MLKQKCQAMNGHFVVLFFPHTSGQTQIHGARSNVTFVSKDNCKSDTKNCAKYLWRDYNLCQEFLKRGCTTLEMLHVNLLRMFTFSRRSQGGLLYIGEQKKKNRKQQVIKELMPKRNVTFLFILSVRKADGTGKRLLHRLTADKWRALTMQ